MSLRRAPGRRRPRPRVLAGACLAALLLSAPLAAVAAPPPGSPSPSASVASPTSTPSASSPSASTPSSSALTSSTPSSSTSASPAGGATATEPAPTGSASAATATPEPTATGSADAARAAAPAVPPPASATTAVLAVRTGGDRSAQEVVAPLAGVVLQLYDGSDSPGDPVDQPWATCTSAADGFCSFVVPDTASGEDNRDRRFWIVQTGAPTGWWTNLYLRTGSAYADGAERTRYTFRTGEQLRAGTTYTSDVDFMRGTGDTVRNVSGGVWQSSRVNPSFPNRCGLRVGLVLDLSTSVSVGGGLPGLKSASKQFVDSLVGTRSTVALFTFNSNAPAAGANNANVPATAVSTASGADVVKNRIDGLTTGNLTNWDRGLFQAAASSSTFDVVFVITDGNPTVYSNAQGPGGYSRFREVENGIFSANAIKAEGTRLVAVGVGSGIAGRPENLSAISGPTINSDYFQKDTYNEAGDALRALALGACQSSVTVVKQVVPSTAPAGSTEGAQVAGGWEFAADPAGPVTSVPVSGTTGARTGALNFDLDFPGGTGDTPVTLSETPQPGFTLQPVGGANAVCTNLVTGRPVAVTDVTDGFTVVASRDDAITCNVYNRAPAPVASLVVDKTWLIDGTRFDAGDRQPDFRGTPVVPGRTNLAFGVELPGYGEGDQVPIDETTDISARPGCTLVSSRAVADNGTTIDAGLPYTATLQAGRNVVLLENVVTCQTDLTLVKQVQGGDADPAAWTLSAAAPAPALAYESGLSGVRHLITPNQDYVLAESGGDPRYAQLVSPDADLADGSSGSWDCRELEADRTTVRAGLSTGLDGIVNARRGAFVRCIAINRTSTLTLVKDVRSTHGGTATAADWTLTATPEGGAPAGVEAQTVPGSATGTVLNIRPDVRYELTESGDVPGYEQQSLSCSIDDAPPVPATAIELDPLDDAVCTFVNVDEPPRWVVTKSSDPVSGSTVDPGSVITYTVTVDKLDGVDPRDVAVEDDLSRVLNHAALVPGSIVASTGTAGLTGDTLSWQLPVVADEETLSYQVEVDADAYGVTLTNAATSPGSSCAGDDESARAALPECPAVTRHVTPTEDTDTPGHHDDPGSPSGSLAGTGGPGLAPLLAGPSLLLGAGLVWRRRRRAGRPQG